MLLQVVFTDVLNNDGVGFNKMIFIVEAWFYR